jgi:hypothetical protein
LSITGSNLAPSGISTKDDGSGECSLVVIGGIRPAKDLAAPRTPQGDLARAGMMGR